MSNRRTKKGNDYDQEITITKTTITKEIDKGERDDNCNNEDLDEVVKAFEYFDMNHSGRINIYELKNVLSSFGNVMTDDEINNIFRAAGIDKDDNEDIDYIKFINYWIGNK